VRKLRAAALVYALVMALIIAILSSSLVLYSWISAESIQANEKKIRMLDNVNSAINLLLAQQTLVGLNESKRIDLFGSGNDSVQLNRRAWGVFEVISASAVWKGVSFSKIALVGYRNVRDSTFCFYLCDNSAPLAVCGKTRLNGTCYLPSPSIKNAYIEGKNFVGEKPVYGIIHKSSKELPRFNKEPFGIITDMLSSGATETGNIVDPSEIPDSIRGSFSSPTIEISSQRKIILASKYLAGNICIRSAKEVLVANTVQLNGVIILAPKIRIEKGFKGSGQFYASDSILVGENVCFEYPSILGLARTKSSRDNIAIDLKKNITINGDLFTYEKSPDNKKKIAISMSEGDTVRGQVFSIGSLSLRGTVYGSVTSSKLVLKTSSASYENHLLDVVIDRNKLSPYFIGINTWGTVEKKEVIQWICE
jgi:hypothetical protein